MSNIAKTYYEETKKQIHSKTYYEPKMLRLSQGSLLRLSLFVPLLFTVVSSQDCPVPGDVRLPKFYQNGAVFQADVSAQIWGFTTVPECPVIVQRNCSSAKIIDRASTSRSDFEPTSGQDDSYVWKLSMPPTASGTECALEITQGDMTINLDIIYGDVWVCSGQSNM